MTVLVLRALGIGDLLVAVPALRALRRARPGERLVLAAPEPLAPLVDRIDAVDDLLACPRPGALRAAWVERRTGVPTLAVNLHGDGEASREALLATRPGRYVGERPDRERSGHERERWCRLLAGAGLLPADELSAAALDLRLGEPCRAARAPVLVHPGAGFGAKRWPVGRFAAVARALDGHDHPVLVTGGADDRALGAVIVRDGGLDPDRDRTGRLELGALIDLVRSAAVVVSGDTGIAHLASAFGVPSVTLFGPVAPRRWGPPPGPHRVLGGADDRRGDPFAADPDPALLAVPVDDVISAVLSLHA